MLHASYQDPLHEISSFPTNLAQHLITLFPNFTAIVQTHSYYRQQDLSSCGPITVSNLITAAQRILANDYADAATVNADSKKERQDQLTHLQTYGNQLIYKQLYFKQLYNFHSFGNQLILFKCLEQLIKLNLNMEQLRFAMGFLADAKRLEAEHPHLNLTNMLIEAIYNTGDDMDLYQAVAKRIGNGKISKKLRKHFKPENIPVLRAIGKITGIKEITEQQKNWVTLSQKEQQEKEDALLAEYLQLEEDKKAQGNETAEKSLKEPIAVSEKLPTQQEDSSIQRIERHLFRFRQATLALNISGTSATLLSLVVSLIEASFNIAAMEKESEKVSCPEHAPNLSGLVIAFSGIVLLVTIVLSMVDSALAHSKIDKEIKGKKFGDYPEKHGFFKTKNKCRLISNIIPNSVAAILAVLYIGSGMVKFGGNLSNFITPSMQARLIGLIAPK